MSQLKALTATLRYNATWTMATLMLQQSPTINFPDNGFTFLAPSLVLVDTGTTLQGGGSACPGCYAYFGTGTTVSFMTSSAGAATWTVQNMFLGAQGTVNVSRATGANWLFIIATGLFESAGV